MKYIVIPYSVYFRTDINSNSKLLYGYIISLSATTGVFYATNSTISDDLGISVSTINNSLKQLEEFKLITINYSKSNYRTVISKESYRQATDIKEYNNSKKKQAVKTTRSEPEWLDEVVATFWTG